MVAFDAVFSNPGAVPGGIDVTFADPSGNLGGSVTITGTISGSTTISFWAHEKRTAVEGSETASETQRVQDFVQTNAQTLTAAQKTQVLTNIGGASEEDVTALSDRMPTLLWTNSSPTTPRGEGTIATGIDFKGFTVFAVKVKAHVSVDRYVSCIVPLASETEMIFVTDTTVANRNVHYRYITINNGNIYITGATGGDGTTYQDRLIPVEVYGIW
jgi:hypothetical protein